MSVGSWQLNHVIGVQDISSVLVLFLTAYIASVAHRFSKLSTHLLVTSESLSIIDDFNKAIVQSSENASEIAALRLPPPGLTIRQEYLLFIYLNQIEYSYRAWRGGLIDRNTLDGFARDGLSYFKGRREALAHMMEPYADHFARFMFESFDRWYDADDQSN